jgi:hypothetical protein
MMANPLVAFGLTVEPLVAFGLTVEPLVAFGLTVEPLVAGLTTEPQHLSLDDC